MQVLEVKIYIIYVFMTMYIIYKTDYNDFNNL